MDFLQILSDFLEDISKKYSLEIKFTFKYCESISFQEEDLKIFSGLQSCFPRKMSEEKGSFCHLCHRKFPHPEILTFHTKVIHENLQISCDTTSEIFCCLTCFKCYRPTDNPDLQCCQNQYFLPESLLDKNNKFNCGYCQENFKHYSRIKFHLKTCQQESNTSKIDCQLCSQSFRSRLELFSHLSVNHSQFVEKPFQCELCPKNFKLRTSYKKHVFQTHQKETIQSFQCDECPKKFIRKIYLTNHKLKFHQLKKDFMCSKCGHQSLTEGAFKKHLQDHQKPSIIFNCSFCQKSFLKKDKVNYAFFFQNSLL